MSVSQDSVFAAFAGLERMSARFRLIWLFDELERGAGRLGSGTTDAGPKEWITVNGAAIPLDKDGEPAGKVGEKIKAAESGSASANASGSARNTLSVAKLDGNELQMHAGESVEDAGIRYFNKQLKDHPAKRNEPGFEEVGFYRSGQTKFKSSHLASQETWKLLPAARPIIEEGYYVGSHELTEAEKSSRKDGVVKFHYFEANVDTPEGKKYIGVTVNEDYRGKKFYNLNEDPDVLWRKSQAKNKTADLAENSARGGGLKDSASGTLDGSIAEEGAEINIWVL